MFEFSISLFRAQFPEFADETKYPTAMVEGYAIDVECMMSNYCGTSEKCYGRLFNLMVAHLLSLRDAINQDGSSGIVLSASVDKVSVSMAQPPYGTDSWKYWLNLTPYGQQLLAMLSSMSSGGFYVGGRPELSAFRKVGGNF